MIPVWTVGWTPCSVGAAGSCGDRWVDPVFPVGTTGWTPCVLWGSLGGPRAIDHELLESHQQVCTFIRCSVRRSSLEIHAIQY